MTTRLHALLAERRQSLAGLTDDQVKDFAIREFKRFIAKSGVENDVELKALLKEIRKVGFKCGITEYEMATIYHADLLLALRRMALQ